MRAFLAAVFCLYSTFANAEESMRKVLDEGYEILFPTSWQEQTTLSPSGQPIKLFYETGSQNKGAGCTVEVALIDKESMPTVSRLSPQQRRALLMAQWDTDDWFVLFPNLPSTGDFKVVNNFKTTIGGNHPASALEYWYRQNGYYYHTRLFFTFATNMQYVLSCFGFGRSQDSAREEFQRNVGTFQRIQYSLYLRKE